MTRIFVAATSIWFGLFGSVLARNSDCSDRLDAPGSQTDGSPVLVLVETNPWAMVLGSDSPRFVLYDNGLAIYQAEDGLRQIQLDKRSVADLRSAVNVGALACLEKHYSTSSWTDQSSEILFFGRGGKLSRISVYGPIPDDREGTALPLPLVRAYQRLAKFDEPKARPWMPDFIEVMVWPYDYAPEPSIVWPSNWPGLDDARTVKHRELYSILLPSKYYQELRAFLSTRHEKGAVEIGGKKWAASYRFPFPQESSWQFKADDPE
ncbi:MAG: hypothetical protein JOZ13_03180 [Alphaproteobacteria bacterium]|nr:hypothetical protein [Alphaproteobacteria bacterium]